MQRGGGVVRTTPRRNAKRWGVGSDHPETQCKEVGGWFGPPGDAMQRGGGGSDHLETQCKEVGGWLGPPCQAMWSVRGRWLRGGRANAAACRGRGAGFGREASPLPGLDRT